MSDFSRYVKMSRIVSFALDECEKSGADYDSFWILAFRALTDIYYSMSAEPKTVRVPILPNKTAPFPNDCVQWTRIGVMGNNGQVVPLAINKNISKYRANNPSRLSDLSADVDDGFSTLPYFLNYFVNGGYTPLFGVVAGLAHPSECNVDEKNRLVVLAADFPYADIVLEFLSSPEKDGDYMVDIFDQEAIIAFIKWKKKLGSEADYYNRRRESRRKAEPIRSQTIEQAIRSGNKYCLKG